MSLTDRTLAFRIVFAAFLIVASAQAIGAGGHAALLGAIEIAAATLFLFRRSQGVALPLLLAIFAAAFVLTAAAGEMPLRFVYYAATAWFIVAVDRQLLARPADAR